MEVDRDHQQAASQDEAPPRSSSPNRQATSADVPRSGHMLNPNPLNSSNVSSPANATSTQGHSTSVSIAVQSSNNSPIWQPASAFNNAATNATSDTATMAAQHYFLTRLILLLLALINTLLLNAMVRTLAEIHHRGGNHHTSSDL